MAARKTIAVDSALHEKWSAAAKAEGQSLVEFVTAAVERRISNDWGARQIPLPPRSVTVRVVKPADCMNRVAAGTFCKVCGTTHGRKP